MNADRILNKHSLVNISNINIDAILLNNFSNKINEILGLLLTPDLINKTITIVAHKYYMKSFKYLVYDTWNCEWRSYRDLKVDEPLLVEK